METPLPPEQEKKRGVGPVMAIVILVLLFAAGAIYFFIQESARFHTPPIEETLNA